MALDPRPTAVLPSDPWALVQNGSFSMLRPEGGQWEGLMFSGRLD